MPNFLSLLKKYSRFWAVLTACMDQDCVPVRLQNGRTDESSVNSLFVLLLLVVCFVNVAVSLIQYDQQTLLDIRFALGKDYYTNFNSTFRSTSSDCSGLFVVPPLRLPIRRRKKK